MAEVRLRSGRGAYNFAQSRYLLESRVKQSKHAAQASSPSAEFILGDIQSGVLRGARSAASRDSYITRTALLGHVDEECCLYTKLQIQNIATRLPPYRINGSFRCTVWSARPQQRPGSCLGPAPGPVVFTRAYSDTGARPEPLYKSKTGYYDILEVSPEANQTQIKTAYYKQSFVFHPDRNAGREHAKVRFFEISEAYTVLGNKALRKKYDRGVLSRSELIATAKPSAKDTGGPAAGEPPGTGQAVVGADRQQVLFDFDKFIKAHYNEQLQRQQDARLYKEEMLKRKAETMVDRTSTFMVMGVMVLMATALGLVTSF
ncbi:DnaJ subfamily C member 30 [Liparis tanakae]|uniref:DnaJ subfamily C member 30 n=1 Tax=Liparis tanakae TaxID=230148 RepID=A0A4Z2IQM0_9TELE|nr:DnaJ subfamily C member 30 [Liparis tanakae]